MLKIFWPFFLGLAFIAEPIEQPDAQTALRAMIDSVSKSDPVETEVVLSDITTCESLISGSHTRALLLELGLESQFTEGHVSFLSAEGKLFLASDDAGTPPMCSLVVQTVEKPKAIAQTLANRKSSSVEAVANVPTGNGKHIWQVKTEKFVYRVSFTKSPDGATGVIVIRSKG